MQICRTVCEIQNACARFRDAHEGVALVPTMGALHEGHLALVSAARGAQRRTIVSIFVNPTQFGDATDPEAYPRTEEADIAALRAAGVDAVFIPAVGEIYPDGDQTIVETTRLANMLHGEVRPGHYRGVATVLCKLFNIVQPDTACFGEKDYQQLQVVRAMVRDLFIPLDIQGVPTVREADGLALSSRNRRLPPQDRAAAVVLSRALDAAERLVAKGTTAKALHSLLTDTITAEPRATLRAVDITEPGSLTSLQGPITGPLAIMLSAEFAGILLIDQREINA